MTGFYGTSDENLMFHFIRNLIGKEILNKKLESYPIRISENSFKNHSNLGSKSIIELWNQVSKMGFTSIKILLTSQMRPFSWCSLDPTQPMVMWPKCNLKKLFLSKRNQGTRIQTRDYCTRNQQCHSKPITKQILRTHLEPPKHI